MTPPRDTLPQSKRAFSHFDFTEHLDGVMSQLIMHASSKCIAKRNRTGGSLARVNQTHSNAVAHKCHAHYRGIGHILYYNSYMCCYIVVHKTLWLMLTNRSSYPWTFVRFFSRRYIHGHDFSTLPAGIFNGLAALTEL